MKFNKFSKLMISLSGLTSLTSLAALSAACSKDDKGTEPVGTQPVNENKEIVIAVDGVQKGMYDNVVAEFNKTEYHTKYGYNIKLLEKDVWSALDTATVGATDTKAVPDLFYGPNDRVTTSVQENVVVDLNEFLKTTKYKDTNIWRVILGDQASQKLIDELVEFGSVNGIKGENITSKFVALRHNQEGIVMVSNKSMDEVRKQLANPDTDSMVELVEAGEAFFRIQDLWYGNGVLAGVFDKLKSENPENKNYDNLMAKILYSLGAKITTGFNGSESNKIPQEIKDAYKEGAYTAARLIYPIFDAVYNKNDSEYKQTVWAKKGISRETLKSLLNSDMGGVQNTVWNLLKDGKISYAIVGTWDIQNTQKTANANTFFNAINVTDEYKYLQAPGSWSYMINIRNNAYSALRREAIVEILKLIYQPKSWLEYYKQDSKIPFVESQKQQLVKDANDFSNPEFNRLMNSVKEHLGYETFEEFTKAFEEYKTKYSISKEKTFQSSMWQKAPTTAEASEQMLLDKFASVEGFAEKVKTVFTDKTEAGSVLGLRDLVKEIFAIEFDDDNDKISQQNKKWLESWKLSPSVFTSTPSEIFGSLAEGDGYHVRKIEKFILGANGDNGDDVDALIQKIKDAISENKLENIYAEAIANAKKLASHAVNIVSDEVIELRVRQALNNYVYDAKIQLLTTEIVKQSKVNKKDGSLSDWTLQETATFYEELSKLDSVGKIMDVISSTKTLQDNGLGIFTTQVNRVDNGNPQFGKLWALWNDRTFGSQNSYQAIYDADKDKNVTEDEFKEAIYQKLGSLFTETAKTIENSQGSTVITFS